jgi:hypothetical protein
MWATFFGTPEGLVARPPAPRRTRSAVDGASAGGIGCEFMPMSFEVVEKQRLRPARIVSAGGPAREHPGGISAPP